jgi:eukaryotic-like serine/threonine-protein kinase
VKRSDSASLTAERWKQIKAIVAEALAENSPDARAALVLERCGGDPELLREVESLLAQTTGTLEEFVEKASAPLRRELPPVGPGYRIGAYAVVRELGRGGMGAVYLAQRADGEFKKQVAIKLLKRGTDTDEVLRRFRGEREILARLEHPFIARLFDAGTSEDGLPYFVMEYVAGSTVREFCAAKALSLDDRLRLFLKICDAVQFAHQNLVVHRDLKPANILITGQGEPKLLDFGIAKLLAPGDGNISLTLADQQCLTPAYASPEQVRGDQITTVSDVYSLGSLLYELLTGKNAHHFSTRHPSPTELLRVVAEQAPQRPSAAATDAFTSRKLRGDLDNIILKALRKEPARRYASVDAFAEDIRRHLEDLPVRARKDTVAYRASKFIQRHKLGVAAAVLVALALIVGSITTAWQAHQARVEKAKAEQRFNEVRKLAHSLIFDYHDQIAAFPGSTKLREQLVRDSLGYLDRLSDEAAIPLMREVGWAYQRIGEIQGGTVTSPRGGTVTMSNLGDIRGALTSFRKALALREKVAALQPSDTDVQQELGTSLTRMGEMSLTLGKPTDAAEYLKRASDIYDRLLAADPSNEILRTKAGGLPFVIARILGIPGGANLGKGPEALIYLRRALASFQALTAEYPAVAKYKQAVAAEYAQIGRVLLNEGKPTEALEYYLKAQALSEVLVKQNAANAFYRRELAIENGNIGNALLALGKPSEALESCRRAVGILESLVAADPDDANARTDLANNYRYVANVLARNNEPAEARSPFGKSVEILGELTAKNPDNALMRYNQGLSYLALSTFLVDTGEVPAAIENALRAAKIGEALVAIDSNNASTRSMLAASYAQLGRSNVILASRTETPADQRMTYWREAKNWYEKSLAIYQELRNKGTLSGADAKKPDELAAEIATCDAALK